MYPKMGFYGGLVLRGVSLPASINLRCRPYNTGHRVISLIWSYL